MGVDKKCGTFKGMKNIAVSVKVTFKPTFSLGFEVSIPQSGAMCEPKSNCSYTLSENC